MLRKILAIVALTMVIVMSISAGQADAEKHYQDAIRLALTDLDRAEEEFKAAMADDDTYVDAYIGEARLLIEGRGQLLEALPYANKAAALAPNNFEAYFIRGTIYFGLATQDTLNKAAADFRKAVEINPGSAPAHRFLGMTYGALYLYNDAVYEYKAAAKYAPTDASINYELGTLLLRLEKNSDAISYLKAAVLAKDGEYSYHWALGIAYYRTKQNDDAVKELQKASALAPKTPGIVCDLGLCYAQMKQYTKAIETYRQAIEIDQNYATAWYNLACVYALRVNVNSAVDNLARAIQLNPKFREMAKTDPDFNAIRSEKAFSDLIKGI